MKTTAFAALCLLVTAAAAAAGSGQKLPGVIGADDRKPLMRQNAFWNATGKIQVSGFSKLESCTGVLVAPDLVITAAHCLTDPVSGKLVRPARINFLAGVNKAANAGHAIGTCVKLLGEIMERGAPVTVKTFGADAALVKLSKPMKSAPVILAGDAALVDGATVTHAGYGRDRRYLLSVHAACRVVGQVEGVSVTDCDTTFGQSGGPVFVEEGGAMKLAAIMVGFSEGLGSMAVPVKSWRKLVDEAACAP